MLETTSQSKQKQQSKRFALKKDIPNIKQFRKLQKHYNNEQKFEIDPIIQQKNQKRKALIEIERLSNLQILDFTMNDDSQFQKDESKVHCDECAALSPFSQNTALEENQQKEKPEVNYMDINLLYSMYIQQQFNEDKKRRCLEWLSKI